MDNLEEECEDAVFEVCDARERYPAACANKLSKILRLKSEINITNIKVDEIQIKEIKPSLKEEDKKLAFFKKFESSLQNGNNSKKDSLNMLENINDLITVAQQLRNEEFCPLNMNLKKFSKT